MSKKVDEKSAQFADQSRNYLILRSTYGKVGIHCFMQPMKNRMGQFPTCVRRVDSNGDMILSTEDKNNLSDSDYILFPEDHVFDITDGMILDLEKPYDKAVWECIKDSPFIAPSRDAKDASGNLLIDGTMGWDSPNPRYGVAELYVDRPGVAETKKVTRRKLIWEACQHIYTDEKGAEGRAKHALLLGKRMIGIPDAEVTNFLLDIAEKTPERVINVYTGSDMNLRLLFIDAREKQVIILRNKIYSYHDTAILGATDDAVITWMKDPHNKATLELIRRETYPELYAKE